MRRGYKVSPVIGPLKVVHNVSSALLSALFKYDTLIPEKDVEEFFLFPFLCMSKLRCRASELLKCVSLQKNKTKNLMLSIPSIGWGVHLAQADLELPRKTLSQKPNQGPVIRSRMIV